MKINKIFIFMQIAFVLLLSGCSKKEQDDSFVLDLPGETKESIQTGELAGKLGVPEGIHTTLEFNASNVESVSINDDEIDVPDVPAVYTQEYSRIELNAEYKKQVAEAIFGDSALYIYDGLPTKVECDKCIDYYKGVQDSPDEFYQIYYSELIEEYEELKEKASDRREENVDYSSNQYIATIGNWQYLLTFKENKGYCSSIELSLYPEISMPDFFELDDDAFGVVESWVSLRDCSLIYTDLLHSDEVTEEAVENNLCVYSLDEAMNIAAASISSITDVPLIFAYSRQLALFYFQETTDVSCRINDGYEMTFVPEIEGIRPFIADLYQVDYINDEYYKEHKNEESSCIITNGTILHAMVASNGLVGFGYDMPLKKISDIQKADLLTWDEIMEALKTGLPDYYAKHQTSYLQMSFNQVELSYYPRETDTGFAYVPVWVFAAVDEKLEEVEQLVLVDAMDGTIIEAK